MADPAYSNPNALVSTQWLADHLDDPNVRIVEVVWDSSGSPGMEVYEAGHIPGSVAWDYKDDYFNPETGDIVGKRSIEDDRLLIQDVPIAQSTNYQTKEPPWSLRARREDILQAIGKWDLQAMFGH